MSRAVRRGLHAAVAVMVFGIVGALFFPNGQGERLTTTAYLAAGFAAILLAIWRCLPEAERVRAEHEERSTPATVAFWLVVTGVLIGSSMMAGSLGGELLVALASAYVLVIAAMFPTGLVAPLHRALFRGGIMPAATRYAVLFGIAAWTVAAAIPAVRPTAAAAGFVMMTTACVFALMVLRPVRGVIGAVAVAALVALVIAATMPSLAQQAALTAYALTALSLALLLFRQRYALSRGESIDS